MSIAITSALDDITNGQSRPSRLQYLTVIRDNAVARKSRFVENLDGSHDDNSPVTVPDAAPIRPSFGHGRADSACFAEDFIPGERGPSQDSEAELFESQSIIDDVNSGDFPRITVEDHSTDETPFDAVDLYADPDTITPLGWWDFDLDLDGAEEDIYDSEFEQEVAAAVSDDEDEESFSVRTPPYTGGGRLETILEQSSVATSQNSPSRSETTSERTPLLPLSMRRVLQKSKSFPIRNVLMKKRKRWGITKSMDDEQLTTNRDRRKAGSSSRSSMSSQASTAEHDSISDHDVHHPTLNVMRARSSSSSEARQTLRRTSSRLKEIFHRLVSSSQRSEERVTAQAKQYRVVSLPEGLCSRTHPVMTQARSTTLGHVSQRQEREDAGRVVSGGGTTLTSDQLLDVLIHGSPLHSLHASRAYHDAQHSPEPSELSDFSPTSTIHRGGAVRELTLSGDDGPLTPQFGSPRLLTPSPLKIQRVGSWARRSLDSDYVSRTFSGFSMLDKFPAPPAQEMSESDRATSGGTWPRGNTGKYTSAGVSIYRSNAPSLRSLDAAAEATATFSIAASDSTTSLVYGTPLDRLHAHGSDTVDDPFTGKATETVAEPMTPTPANRFRASSLPSPTPTPSPISVPSPLHIRRPVKLKDYTPFPAPPVSARPAKARSMLRSFSSTLNLSIRGGRGSSRASNISRQLESPRRRELKCANRLGTPMILPLETLRTNSAVTGQAPATPLGPATQPRRRRRGILGMLKLFVCGANVEADGDTGSTSSSRRSALTPRNELRKSRTVQIDTSRQTRPARGVVNRSWWACANCMGGNGFHSQGGAM